jgi:hypothetical protein
MKRGGAKLALSAQASPISEIMRYVAHKYPFNWGKESLYIMESLIVDRGK